MDHQVNTLLRVSLEEIQKMIDVDTIVGDTIEISEGCKVIPISRVRMGFLSGGSDIGSKEENPFGGGAGGTIFISPIAFLVSNNGNIDVIPLEKETHLSEKLLDMAPDAITRITNLFKDMTQIEKI